MAYVIIDSQNRVYKIASNDEDKNNLNCDYSIYTAISVSDVDFNNVKQAKSYFTYENNAIVSNTISSFIWENVDSLKSYHEHIKQMLSEFLTNVTSSHVFYTRAQNYLNTLNNFNYDNITFPLAKSWETYCEENSIDYLNSLQIP